MPKETLPIEHHVDVKVESLKEFKGSDLTDLCEASESSFLDNSLSFSIGTSRTKMPTRQQLESYWRGVLLVPERELIVGRIDGVIASSIQLLKPAPNNQTSYFSGSVDHHFVAPWARGHGLAKALIIAVEEKAKESGLTVLRLSVRENLIAAIKLYESFGYQKWGTLDKYEKVENKMLAGFFYYKDLI